MSRPHGAKWADPLVCWWFRITYCRKHGHRYSAFGGEVDDYCMNCGKDRR